MIIEDVVIALKADIAVSGYVGDRITAFSTGSTDDGIVFNFSPQTDDKISRVDKLEIMIISKSVARVYEIHEAVKNALLTFGDDPFNDTILGVEINGGGVLENLKTGAYHHRTYYYLRSRV